MKRITILTISILLLSVSCVKQEEGNPKPEQLNATDGFAVGCIHLEFEKDPNVNSVIVERREQGNGEWQVLTGTGLTSFDDNSGYPNTGMPPGKVFEYRIKNDWPEDAEYSDIDEGYAYDIIPVMEMEITSNIQWDNKTLNMLTWNEGNNGTFINQSEIFFEIYRSDDSLGTYQKVGQVGEDRSFTDELPAEMLGTKVYYRIDVYYEFELNLSSGGLHFETTTPLQGTIQGVVSDSGENPTVDYTTTSLGQVVQSTQGGIPLVAEKNIDGVLYLGLINDAGATGYGVPQLYRLNGTSWQEEWITDPENEFDVINYAIAADGHYLAGIEDSLCVYKWTGSSWSENLASDNLGQADAPSLVSVEVDNGALYMAITQHPDYGLQVLKYNGTVWDTVGGDADGIIASGDIYEVNLEKQGGNLYLYYRIDNTLYIKHFDGSSWVTDLTWTKDNIADIDIALSGSDIYFISGSGSSAYRGGVYKVTSASTAEEIVSNETGEWFQFPLALTVDTENNLIVASMKYDESTTSYYPYLNVYDGTEWKTISGDFSDGTDPVSLCAMGTDIIYIYGDAASENGSGYPTLFNSIKLSRQ